MATNKYIRIYAFGLYAVFIIHLAAAVGYSLEKRDRWSGLYKTESSSTIGKGNMFLTMYGRGFLWDNNAAENIPTAIPHFELGYGVFDFMHVSGGGQIMTTKPSSAFLKIKITTPNTKNLRFFGAAQTFEFYKNLLDEFKSNGYRFENEGFSPDFFILGNDNLITYYRFITAFDIETIKFNSRLPFKFYLNAGFEGGIDWLCRDSDPDCWFSKNGGRSSWIGSNIKEAWKTYSESNQIEKGDLSYQGTTNFQKIPLRIGAELKTQTTDFFLELEAEPFLEHFKSIFRNGVEEEAFWVRFNSIVKSDDAVFLKVFDIHMFETPIYVNAGGRLKYPNGLTLQAGASWLLSGDFGPKLGPCNKQPACMDGATDGFSPFNPQWRVFGRISLPIKFNQTSAELYRTYLLRRNSKTRKVIDIDEDLKDRSIDIDEIENIKDSKRILKFEKREPESEK